ncbi:hypothetical protein [Rubellimicrobium roseum]|uniref:Uncharacterized protein n=1 Tax=Rubellimicrobium roseum TaxID=687525 RepID=A0A5C4NDA6_9RHOB|nr:hypothetical protein [Rubellimicrobium roseum]TNC66424.1 hypothetical protein FHG71_16720 [Rubellimicrobium roseum]
MLHLHNPANQAHLKELEGRLSSLLAAAPVSPFNAMDAEAVTCALIEVVRGFDRGLISAEDAEGIFSSFHVPGFSFPAWLAEMADEDVYVAAPLRRAA